MIFQQFNLAPRMDVVSNVLHGTLNRRATFATMFNLYPDAGIHRAIEILDRLGALAILLTDTGTFGKMFSEALENVDSREIEGVQSTGAKPLQRHRFGVTPQITPVLLRQRLHHLVFCT